MHNFVIMRSNNKRHFLFATTCALLSISCLGTGPYYSVPMASLGLDIAAKRFDAIHDRSVVFIFRNDKASWARTPISIDGQEIGFMVPSTFFRIELNPGIHEINVSTETNRPGDWRQHSEIAFKPEHNSIIKIEAKAEINIFIRLAPLRTDQVWFKPDVVPEDKGKKEIEKSRLISIIHLPKQDLGAGEGPT